MSSLISPKNSSLLPGAWKPGDTNPSEYSTTTSGVMQGPSGNKGRRTSMSPTTASTDSNTPAKKTLSGTTMNMRFMQRRREWEAVEWNRKRKANQQEDRGWNQDLSHSEDGCTSNDTQSGISHEHITIVTDTTTNNSTTSPTILTKVRTNIVTTATDTDMYGSDIIGRRSFGGFHKSVGETWEAAVAVLFTDILTSTNKKGTPKEDKSTISDEELFSRYKTCISGDTNDYEKKKQSNTTSRRKSSNDFRLEGTPKNGRPVNNLHATAKKRKKSI